MNKKNDQSSINLVDQNKRRDQICKLCMEIVYYHAINHKEL